MIEKSQLIEMFATMREQAPWDIDSALLWGYFFTGPRENELRSLADELLPHDYRFVELRQDDQDPNYWLHLARVEIHSAETLDVRNHELSRLASKHGVEYDGMDVGPAPK